MFIDVLCVSHASLIPFRNFSPISRRSLAVLQGTSCSVMAIRFLVTSSKSLGLTFSWNHISSKSLTRSYRSRPRFLSTIL